MACVILAAIAGKELQLAEDVFKLQHLLDCHLLQHREEVEEITTAAVKEEQIETKLASIEADWVTMNLVRALARDGWQYLMPLRMYQHPPPIEQEACSCHHL